MFTGHAVGPVVVPLHTGPPGASFGEVELLRSDELSTPRLATCTCIGQPSGGGCEVLVVTEHMFDLLTDTFKGVRSGLGLQVKTFFKSM